jgi:hypothetical protein
LELININIQVFQNIILNKLFTNHEMRAGHSIFAHSRPDKIGAPRLLPLDLYEYFIGLSAKKSAQIPWPARILWLDKEKNL